MPKFNVHGRCKDNKPTVLKIVAKDGDTAKIEGKKQGLAYVSKVKVDKQ